MRSAAQLLIPVLIPRAFVLWALIRLVVAVLPLAGGEAFGSIPPPPIGVVILLGVVGLIDVRVRGERILWANLGVSSIVLCAVYSTAAIFAELILALLLQ